uniref:tRNA-dihydrouridine(47) synthase [NAD(P)(+)] n=1 Tax=Plectus sambesii TaxID=2011161 RepID=A0A914XB99_9BILA
MTSTVEAPLNCNSPTLELGLRHGSEPKDQEDEETLAARMARIRMIGMAPIKREYLYRYPAKGETSVDTNQIIKGGVTSEEGKDVKDDEKEDKEGEEEPAGDAEGEAADAANPTAPVARPKQRGMNKARKNARPKRDSAKLCPSLVFDDRKCRFGAQCRYMHDREAFWRTKPADLGPSCPVFEQRGRCPYTLSCRFAGAHTADDGTFEQKSDEAVAAKWAPSRNVAPMVLQKALRQRSYDFTPSKKALESVGSIVEDGVGDLEAPIGPPMERRVMRSADWADKLYLAPLTTVGNLPFRRVCVGMGAEITCGEMAIATSLLMGSASEWSLIKRHPCERFFGAQIAGGYPDTMTKCAQALTENVEIDFLDINLGCPIDLVNQKGGGCALANRPPKLIEVLRGIDAVTSRDEKRIPITIKMRTGLKEGQNTAHSLIAKIIRHSPPDLITMHGRSKEQRYSKVADWDYVKQCADLASPLPFFACGDVMSYDDYYKRKEESSVTGIMIGRGALLKPWIFTEIQERRHWDISATERFDILKQYVNYGLDHWGSDDQGVNTTRRFLLELLSFQYRYIPVGLLEVLPQRMNDKPPGYFGRSELETLLASDRASDWIKISEMLLGPVPDNLDFVPKHRANAY